ncbi:MAG: hypothetical protein KDD44_04540 [Bdellovibrionales bacterium]|nr:hypothetical protein [Bdellovibrionales bacterium]
MSAFELPDPDRYPPVNFEFAATLGLSEEEWKRLIEGMGRTPNSYECLLFAILWSEECSQKSSRLLLQTTHRTGPQTMKLSGSRVGGSEIGYDEACVFSVAHNNAEFRRNPYFAAQAVIANALAELIAVGVQPMGFTAEMRFGDPETPEVARLIQQAVDGMSEYSNRFGLPLVSVDVGFHPRYDGSAIMTVSTIGYTPIPQLFRGSTCGADYRLLYLGAPTDTAGLSPVQTTDDGKQIQLPPRFKLCDPLFATSVGRALMSAIREELVSLIVPLSLGGLGFGLFDVATRSGFGLRVDLDRVPALEGLDDPGSLLASLTPDRFLLVVSPDHYRTLVDVLVEAGFRPQQIGQLVAAADITCLMNHRAVAVVPHEFAASSLVERTFELVKFPPMLKNREAESSDDDEDEAAKPRAKSLGRKQDEWSKLRETPERVAARMKGVAAKLNRELGDLWIDLLASPNVSSRGELCRRFDRGITNALRFSAPVGAAVLRLPMDVGITDRPERAIAVAQVATPRYGLRDSYLASVHAVATAMRQIAAAGAHPLAVSQGLNFGNPSRHREISEFAEAARGLSDACRVWDIPILGDAVSLYNGSESNRVLGLPCVGMYGILPESAKAVAPGFLQKGQRVLLIGETRPELGCSEFMLYCRKQTTGQVPDIDFDRERMTCELVEELAHQGLLSGAKEVGIGGLAVSLAEASLASGRPLGVKLQLDADGADGELSGEDWLFSETSARFILVMPEEHEAAVRGICSSFGVSVAGSGTVGGKALELEGAVACSIPLSTANQIWSRGLNHVLGLTARAAQAA